MIHNLSDPLAVNRLAQQLASTGGCLVSSADASEAEMADARMRGDWYQLGSLGFIRRLPEWMQRHSRFARNSRIDACEFQPDALPETLHG